PPPQLQPPGGTNATGAAAAASGPKGLHIAQRQPVNFTYTINDGAGFRWDIQYYGTIGQGTNYAYSGGLYLQINGSSVHSNGKGWMSPDGDEVEIGPYVRNSVRVYRRVKVYKDRGLARWLDIYENTSSQDVTLNVRVYSNTNWSIGSQTYSTGKATFTNNDFAFVTQSQGGNAPALLHYVCGRKSKLRPTVSIQNNQIYVNWSLTVPARKTAVICYFESQNHSPDALVKLMNTLRPRDSLKDLTSSVRKLIANMPVALGIEDVELERAESADVVFNKNGDPIYGTIANESFSVQTLFGQMTVPSGEVIGMASAGGEDEAFRILLAGGQIVAGRMPDDAKVRLTMPAGGALQVPFSDVRQCSYRISKDRPEDVAFAGPLMILRTGDRVAFQGESAELKLRTRYGLVPLAAKDLLNISLDNPGNAVHRVTFLNGSKLAGFLEPQKIPVTLRLGPKLAIDRHLVTSIQFAAEERPDATLDSVTLSNGDELFGRLAAEKLTLKTDYGPVALRPENIQAIAFSPTHLGRAALQLWDGSVLRGQCSADTLAFEITPGPIVSVYIGQFVRIQRSQALPPREIREQLQKLVGQLGAESYKDRQAATEALVRMGKGVIPMLRKYLTTSDPEVRQRIEDVINRLGGGSGTPGPPHPPMPNGVIINRAGAVWNGPVVLHK
ncbi:MAG: hypothetical protein WBF17_04735, partial [Phycisphaerae bacterium]